MRTNNMENAREIAALHLVNCISREVLADRHVDYLQPPGSNNSNPLRALTSSKKPRPMSDEEQEVAFATLERTARKERRQLDPTRLTPEVHRLLPYSVTVSAFEVSAGKQSVGLPFIYAEFAPGAGRYAGYSHQHVVKVMDAETGKAKVVSETPVYTLGCTAGDWDAIREGGLPVRVKDGRWKWRDHIKPEARSVWLRIVEPLLKLLLDSKKQRSAA